MENRKRLSFNLSSIKIGNAFHVGTYFNIPVRIHWTFGLLIIFALWSAFLNGLELIQTIGFMIYIFALFLCVIFHEYGHALVAGKFGIRTRDILLSPVGGIARLEKLPQQPIHEFFIAIAGPVVNMFIGIFLAVFVKIVFGSISPDLDMIHFNKPSEFFRYLVWINLGLFTFNLIPAFPMDGGRILRSLLSVRMGKERATRLASGLGRVIAVLFILAGVLNQQLILSLIGIFIFMMAGSEFQQVRLDKLLKTTTAGQIQLKDFHKVYDYDSYESIMPYISKRQNNFLVFNQQEKLIGALPAAYLKEMKKSGNLQIKVSEKIFPRVTTVGEAIVLDELIQLMKREALIIVGVEDSEGTITGIVDRERIERYLQYKGA